MVEHDYFFKLLTNLVKAAMHVIYLEELILKVIKHAIYKYLIVFEGLKDITIVKQVQSSLSCVTFQGNTEIGSNNTGGC
jgi:hypothetical protein